MQLYGTGKMYNAVFYTLLVKVDIYLFLNDYLMLRILKRLLSTTTTSHQDPLLAPMCGSCHYCTHLRLHRHNILLFSDVSLSAKTEVCLQAVLLLE